jgi:predicted secreted protein
MAANYGRKVTFEWNGDEVLGVREKGLSINGEAANITSDEDDGYQVLLDEDAEASIELSLSGVSKDTVFRAAKANGTIRGTATVTWTNGDTLTFDANLGSYSEGMPYNEAITFEVTLQSSGAWTYTAGSTGT